MSVKLLLATNDVQSNYIASVESCGSIAVAKYLPEMDLSYDGLILCGGEDVDPKYYGEEINGSVGIDAARDTVEFALAKAYIEAGKPVLGICRGCQLLNVYFGGSLIQHLDTSKRHVRATEAENVHDARTVGDNIIRQMYGEHFVINSSHHQAVKQLGENLEITMVSGEDDVVEGFVHKFLPVIAVQWHPERIAFERKREDSVDGAEIFRYFIKLCENHKERTA